MVKSPLVSVNITTYNRAYLLKRCVDSILSQSYKNIEIIVVDDHSTDNTQEIVRSFIDKDSRIKYFKHEENVGNAHARNTALKESSGYYIAFMDDDDEWIDKDKIMKQVTIFEESQNDKLAIISTSVIIVDKNGNETQKKIVEPSNLKVLILKGNGLIYNSTVMTKKSILTNVGGFDIKLSRGIDSDFYRRCILKNYLIQILDDITAKYSEYGDDRITLVNSRKKTHDTIVANLYIVLKYMKYFIVYPQALIYRMKIILQAIIRLVKML